MAGIWYFQQNGQTYGPVSKSHIEQLFLDGKLALTDIVRGEGMDDWVPVSSLSTPTTKPPVTPPPTPPPRPTAVTPKTVRRPSQNNSAIIWSAAAVSIVLVSVCIGWLANSMLRRENEPSERSGQVASRNSPARVNGASSSAGNPPTESRFPQTKVAREEEPFVLEPKTGGLSEVKTAEERELTNAVERTKPVETIHTPVTKSPGSPSNTQTEPVPTTEPEPTPSEESIVLYQELQVARNPSFVIQGISISQEIQYRVLSRLHLGPVRADGMRSAEQTIKDTKLVKSDPLSRSAFESSLRDLIGQQFSFTLNKHHEVIKFVGYKDTKKTISAKTRARDGFLVTSVMDEDGWKELAQLSFFLPKENAENGSWKRQITHDWRELGSWYGATTFSADDQSQQVKQYRFSHDLTYMAPEKTETSSPLVITSAKFELQNGSGTIRFDAGESRVAVAEEKFHAKGELETQILGQTSKVTLEEQQILVIRLFNQNPWAQ